MSPKDFPQLPSAMANQQYCLKWNNHQSNLLRAFDRLLQSESFTDVTLACEGRSLRAHKVVLSACSNYFETLFEEHPDRSPIIILKDMKFIHVSQLVNFMYRGEINITQDMLSGLLKTAETLKVKGLAEVSNDQQANMSQQFNPLTPNFRLANHGQPQMIAPAVNSPLTAALNSPVSTPNLGSIAALLTPETSLDDRRKKLLKRLSQSQDHNGESVQKMARREVEDLEDSLHSPLPHMVPHSIPGLTPPLTIPSAPKSVPLLYLNHSVAQQRQVQQQVQQHQEQLKQQQEQMKQQQQEQLKLQEQQMKQQQQEQEAKQQEQQQQSSEKQQAAAVAVATAAAAAALQSSSMPTSPLQPILTPIPQELTVNAQQDLPDFLQGFSVFRLNDYLGFRTRQQFWEEPAVRRIMEAIKNKEIDMKSAAELLGVSYGTLYGRYREVFGYLKHSWVNKPGRTAGSSSKDRCIWEESRAQELINAVLNKELSLTAAAVRLGVDTNTFFAHLTDNGKNKARVTLLMGPGFLTAHVPNDDSGDETLQDPMTDPLEDETPPNHDMGHSPSMIDADEVSEINGDREDLEIDEVEEIGDVSGEVEKEEYIEDEEVEEVVDSIADSLKQSTNVYEENIVEEEEEEEEEEDEENMESIMKEEEILN